MGFSTMQNGIYHLRGIVKHYDWGGFSFIPSLLKLDNLGERPFAEYWLGIHQLGTSLVDLNGDEKRLSELIPALPFLLKILDVNNMLSIQVHPSKQGAERGFEEEEKKGVSLEAPFRNYKDRNHKPELMIALSDFWLLHGFKPPEELEFTLLNVVELRELLPVFNHKGYEGLYRYVMEMPQQEVNRILEPLLKNIKTIYQDNEPDKDDEDFWVAKAAELFCPEGHIDRGIFSIFLLNLVHLNEGEGIFQDAGVPHAYLEGKNIEIMANSDNVLRGGLTNKHISIEELLKHVKCEPVIPQILHGKPMSSVEKIYEVPAREFTLSLIEVEKEDTLVREFVEPAIVLITEGEAEIAVTSSTLKLNSGNPAIFINTKEPVNLKAHSKAKIFLASSP
jgi:mannose-6-phosphate isomerase